MRGSEFAKLLPEPGGFHTRAEIALAYNRRDAMIVQAVRDNLHSLSWFSVDLSTEKFKASALVSNPLMVGSEDPLIVSMSAGAQQSIADLLRASLLTPRVVDLAHMQAELVVDMPTQTWWADGSMGHTNRMREHSAQLRKLAPSMGSKLVSSLGKDWVLCSRLNTLPTTQAANYGGVAVGGRLRGEPPLHLAMHQSLGCAHDVTHGDYSQLARYMTSLKIDGREANIAEVLTDPERCEVLSSTGVVTRTRYLTLPMAAAAPLPRATPRTLRRGDTGAGVAEWQRALGIDDDGVFGPATEAATKTLQHSRGLTPDGVVGPLTRAVAATIGRQESESVAATIPFVAAKHYTAAVNRPIDLVVLHTAELPEAVTAAEAVAAYFKDPKRRAADGSIVPVTASAHYCIDADSVVQCVREENVAFAAPGANKNGIQIELAGYAKQSPEDWADAFSDAMLRRAAALVADICRRYKIPISFVSSVGLLAGERGITTHGAASKAFKKSTHTDPGPNFPIGKFLEYVQAHS